MVCGARQGKNRSSLPVAISPSSAQTWHRLFDPASTQRPTFRPGPQQNPSHHKQHRRSTHRRHQTPMRETKRIAHPSFPIKPPDSSHSRPQPKSPSHTKRLPHPSHRLAGQKYSNDASNTTGRVLDTNGLISLPECNARDGSASGVSPRVAQSASLLTTTRLQWPLPLAELTS